MIDTTRIDRPLDLPCISSLVYHHRDYYSNLVEKVRQWCNLSSLEIDHMCDVCQRVTADSIGLLVARLWVMSRRCPCEAAGAGDDAPGHAVSTAVTSRVRHHHSSSRRSGGIIRRSSSHSPDGSRPSAESARNESISECAVVLAA